MSPSGLKAEKHKTQGMGMQLLSWQELSYSFWTESAKSPAPPDCFEFRPAEDSLPSAQHGRLGCASNVSKNGI